MEETLSIEETLARQGKVKRSLLYISIFSILMLFAGLTSGYIVRQADGNWMEFELPAMFWISTGLILLSSLTMNFAVQSTKKNNFSGVKTYLLITILLGIGFSITQFLGWNILIDSGIYFAGRMSNPSGSFMYVLTGVHLAHIVSGLIFLLAVYLKANKNYYNSTNNEGIKRCAIYWHFLDFLWIYLFFFLMIIR
jgi:cytochrome c oxidase subunit 3